MITKTISSPSIQTLPHADDLSALRRLLVAAAINLKFRTNLLKDPEGTIRQGFGGETFHLSDYALGLISSIQASSLGEFIQQVNEDFPIL
ncbi:MAG: hypothetical protein U0V02_06420 [Anaerolineales bacterium]